VILSTSSSSFRAATRVDSADGRSSLSCGRRPSPQSRASSTAASRSLRSRSQKEAAIRLPISTRPRAARVMDGQCVLFKVRKKLSRAKAVRHTEEATQGRAVTSPRHENAKTSPVRAHHILHTHNTHTHTHTHTDIYPYSTNTPGR